MLGNAFNNRKCIFDADASTTLPSLQNDVEGLFEHQPELRTSGVVVVMLQTHQ